MLTTRKCHKTLPAKLAHRGVFVTIKLNLANFVEKVLNEPKNFMQCYYIKCQSGCFTSILTAKVI